MTTAPVVPSNSRVRLGAKLRAARRSQGFTIRQVAEATDLTKGFISRVERDETSPSVSTLVTLCQALSLPVGDLFAAPRTELIRASEAPEISMGLGSGVNDRVISPRSQPAVQVMRSKIEPGGYSGPELYSINCEVEVLHVISGSVEIEFASENVTLESGDTLTLGGREPHRWRNAGTGVTEVVWVMVPAPWSRMG